MSRNQQPVDEYTLAAFLAGTLAEEQRREVAAFLAENSDARELLCMAQEAMETAERPSVAEPIPLPSALTEETAPSLLPTTPPLPRPAGSRGPVLRNPIFRIATMGLLVIVLSVALHVGWKLSTTDALRGTRTGEEQLEVRVSTPALQFEWNEVKDAYYYRLVIFDVEHAEVVAEHSTKSTRVGRNDAFVLSLYRELTPGRLYSARIDAFDIQNRTIQSSTMVDFPFEE